MFAAAAAVQAGCLRLLCGYEAFVLPSRWQWETIWCPAWGQRGRAICCDPSSITRTVHGLTCVRCLLAGLFTTDFLVDDATCWNWVIQNISTWLLTLQAPPSRQNLFNTVWNPSNNFPMLSLQHFSMFKVVNLSFMFLKCSFIFTNTQRRHVSSFAPNVICCSVDRKWCLWATESSTSGSLLRMRRCSCTKIKPWDRWLLTRWRIYNRLLLWWARTLQSVQQAVYLLNYGVETPCSQCSP